MPQGRFTQLQFIGMLLLVSVLGGCSSSDENSVTIYSGRSSSLVGPLLEQFTEDTGIEFEVKYASTAGTVALLLEEGENSPADVVFLQDAGALGALAKSGMLIDLPVSLLDRVDPKFRSPHGDWVGVSGRARTVVYNTGTINPNTDLPASILNYTAPEWQGRIGWAPTNGSFQAFVTALRVLEGDASALAWLQGIQANGPVAYPNNRGIVQGTASGEVDVGFVNHYYLHAFIAEQGQDFQARNHYSSGDAGALINVAGVGILRTNTSGDLANRFVDYLLDEQAQTYFAQKTSEYPLSALVDPIGEMPTLSSLNPPDIDLGNLDDLRGTLDLMREAGVLP